MDLRPDSVTLSPWCHQDGICRPVNPRTNGKPEPAPWNLPSAFGRPNTATLTRRVGTALMVIPLRHGRTGERRVDLRRGWFRDELDLVAFG